MAKTCRKTCHCTSTHPPIEDRVRRLMEARSLARFYLGLTSRLAGGGRFEVRILNGLPALLMELPKPREGFAPRAVFQLRVAGDGRVRAIYRILASRKLAAINPLR